MRGNNVKNRCWLIGWEMYCERTGCVRRRKKKRDEIVKEKIEESKNEEKRRIQHEVKNRSGNRDRLMLKMAEDKKKKGIILEKTKDWMRRREESEKIVKRKMRKGREKGKGILEMENHSGK